MAGGRNRNVVAGDELQFIVFRLAEMELAVNIFQVVRILRFTAPAASPAAPAFVEGVIPYDGAMLPLVDLRKRLGLPAEQREETRIMVLELEGQRVALAVDQVHETLRVDSRTIGRPEQAAAALPAEWVSGTIERPGRTLAVLHATRVLSRAERQALAEKPV